jgi:hypothetical protein
MTTSSVLLLQRLVAVVIAAAQAVLNFACRCFARESEGRMLGGVVHDAVVAPTGGDAFAISMPDDAHHSVRYARAIRARRWFAQSSIVHESANVDRLSAADEWLERSEEKCRRSVTDEPRRTEVVRF